LWLAWWRAIEHSRRERAYPVLEDVLHQLRAFRAVQIVDLLGILVDHRLALFKVALAAHRLGAPSSDQRVERNGAGGVREREGQRESTHVLFVVVSAVGISAVSLLSLSICVSLSLSLFLVATLSMRNRQR
jgi:hypothetical protein